MAAELATRRRLRMAWQRIEHNPLSFVRLAVEKFMRLASGQAEVARLRDARPSPGAAVGQALFPLTQFSHLSMLFCAAFVLWRRAGFCDQLPVLVASAFLLQILLFNIWFEIAERHCEGRCTWQNYQSRNWCTTSRLR